MSFRTASQLATEMSPRFDTSGYLYDSSAAAPGSLSAVQAVSAPVTWRTASSRIPVPVQILPSLKVSAIPVPCLVFTQEEVPAAVLYGSHVKAVPAVEPFDVTAELLSESAG